MAAPRAVRIARAPASAETVRPGPSASAARPGAFHPNENGTQRGRRLFLIFVVALVAAYAAFVGLILTTPAASSEYLLVGVLGLVAVLFALWAWSITWGRAPRGVRWLPDRSVRVIERLGTQRSFPGPPDLRVNVAYRYPPSFLNRGPVELVEVSGGETRRRAYLVDAGTFDESLE